MKRRRATSSHHTAREQSHQKQIMDLLASLGLENALPEQSTRLVHPGVISALEKCSSAAHDNDDDNGGSDNGDD